MTDRRIARNQARPFQSNHRRRAFCHYTREPKRMRADNREATRQPCTLAFDAVRIEERTVVVRSLIYLRLLLHDPNIGVRDAELAVSVVISNSFQQSLPGAERQRN